MGVKIRVASRELASLLEKVGASPIFMPWAEAIPALERGTVDAISTGWSGIVEWKIYDIVDNIWVMDLNVFPILWAVNKDALAELPAEYRDVLLQVSKEFNEKLKTEWRAAELELRATAEKEATVTDIAPEEKAKFIALAKPVWDEWAKEDALSRQALDVALATLK
jgi:TRAP-type C4-dicarboxylate transport system substrate-binding protein